MRLAVPLMIGALAASMTPRALAAQRLVQLPVFWDARSALESGRDGPPLIKSGDYRLEGVVIGGVLLGGASALLGSLACGADPAANGSPRSCAGIALVGGAVGVAVGGVLGYFVGKSLPKYRPADTP